MKILTKKLGKGEINWKGVVIPRSKKELFPVPGVEFDLLDGKSVYKAKMDVQSRLRAPDWFKQHRNLKPGDEITFLKENGKMKITLLKNFTDPHKETLDWAEDVIQAIKNDEICARITINKSGFSVEIGDHIKRTEVLSGAK